MHILFEMIYFAFIEKLIENNIGDTCAHLALSHLNTSPCVQTLFCICLSLTSFQGLNYNPAFSVYYFLICVSHFPTNMCPYIVRSNFACF